VLRIKFSGKTATFAKPKTVMPNANDIEKKRFGIAKWNA
jgi:hypothetical protein